VASIAAVVAAVTEAAVAVATEAAGDDSRPVYPRQVAQIFQIERGHMQSNKNSYKRESILSMALLVLAVISLAGCTRKAATQSQQQPTYATPAAAGEALQQAAKNGDSAGITTILGPGSDALVYSGDKTEDQKTVAVFVAKYNRMHRWTRMTDGSQILYIGADNYPFPISLAQNNASQWYFNTPAGKIEILARRIGRNELLAMDASYAIGRAQQQYFNTAIDGKPKKQYAQIILSSQGKKDGLYWKASANEPVSPLGRVEEFADVETQAGGQTQVFDGYTFRILTAQGHNAKGGAKSYLKDGKLTDGFAVIASPVKYRDSGVMTFLLGPDGTLLEKDLGANTVTAAAAIENYNPDNTWTPSL
jgi:hypothetical protein